MSQKSAKSPIIVIFGITGDLSHRYLLPALYHMLKVGSLDSDTKIIGVSRKKLDKSEFMASVDLCVQEKDNVCDPEALKKVEHSLSLFQLDPDEHDDYLKLKRQIGEADPNNNRVRMFYMSVPSKAYEPIVTHLADVGLNSDNCRLLLEKPFGYDPASAKHLIDLVDKSFNEKLVYRIDHYLAKETAQNLLAFRMHNPIFSALWNQQYVQRVIVRAYETLGLEGRANFYEQTGALRDFVQSHLMQLLSITLMDVPKTVSSQSIHERKYAFLKGLNNADPKLAVRGQYDGYKKEVDNPKSFVETFARLTLFSSLPNWQGTEMVLETGKAMNEKCTEVVIEFKTPHERSRNSLTFQIQPNEGISLDLVVKEPGLENDMKHEALDFRYDSAFHDYEYVDAYERVLMDAINGDQSLFASNQEVLETWRVLEPVLNSWTKDSSGLVTYSAGSKEVNLG
ncbi:MAG TPA: glucose-6-phosphate dehydrogenase [Candidatus Sulfotelmatobacter sp.]|nr:glucose-6-phosphate dehydrogenase [Candidatus Sulfotelmatobacter sp.]